MLAMPQLVFVVEFMHLLPSGKLFSVAPRTHMEATCNSGTLTTTTKPHSLTSLASAAGPNPGLNSTSEMLPFVEWVSTSIIFPASDLLRHQVNPL